MKKVISLLLIYFTIPAACLTSNGQAKGFKIIGSTIGLADSTLILFDDITSSALRDIDSTYILNGKFQFSGSIKGKALHVIIRTRDNRNVKFLWLENSIITFKGEKDKF